jgi:hypothetical protein
MQEHPQETRFLNFRVSSEKHSEHSNNGKNKYRNQAEKKDFDRNLDGRTCHDTASVAILRYAAKYNQPTQP